MHSIPSSFLPSIHSSNHLTLYHPSLYLTNLLFSHPAHLPIHASIQLICHLPILPINLSSLLEELIISASYVQLLEFLLPLTLACPSFVLWLRGRSLHLTAPPQGPAGLLSLVWGPLWPFPH